jgi:hypothetical protein
MNAGVASLATAVALMLSTSVFAADPKPVKPSKPMSVDESASFLIDPAVSEKLWAENIPAKVRKLYPSNKFRFVTEVGGGFNEAKTCIVSARAMMLPVVRLPIQGPKAIYAPIKSSTAFDAVPNLSREQCQALARSKLKEAIQSVASALAAT